MEILRMFKIGALALSLVGLSFTSVHAQDIDDEGQEDPAASADEAPPEEAGDTTGEMPEDAENQAPGDEDAEGEGLDFEALPKGNPERSYRFRDIIVVRPQGE